MVSVRTYYQDPDGTTLTQITRQHMTFFLGFISWHYAQSSVAFLHTQAESEFAFPVSFQTADLSAQPLPFLAIQL